MTWTAERAWISRQTSRRTLTAYLAGCQRLERQAPSVALYRLMGAVRGRLAAMSKRKAA